MSGSTMLASTMSGSTMSLYGAPGVDKDEDDSPQKRSAILVHLNKEAIKHLQQSYQTGKVVQLLGGHSPVYCPSSCVNESCRF